jgi:hypothetical protein
VKQQKRTALNLAIVTVILDDLHGFFCILVNSFGADSAVAGKQKQD